MTYACDEGDADYAPAKLSLRPRGRALRRAWSRGEPRRRVRCPCRGMHNVENALGVSPRPRRWACPPTRSAQRLRVLPRREAAAGGARRARRRPGDRRLRAPSHRGARDHRRDPPALSRPAAVGGLRAALQHQPPQHPPGGVRRGLRPARARVSIKVPEPHDKVPLGRAARRAASSSRSSGRRASTPTASTDVRRIVDRSSRERSRATCCW